MKGNSAMWGVLIVVAVLVGYIAWSGGYLGQIQGPDDDTPRSDLTQCDSTTTPNLLCSNAH